MCSLFHHHVATCMQMMPGGQRLSTCMMTFVFETPTDTFVSLMYWTQFLLIFYFLFVMYFKRMSWVKRRFWSGTTKPTLPKERVFSLSRWKSLLNGSRTQRKVSTSVFSRSLCQVCVLGSQLLFIDGTDWRFLFLSRVRVRGRGGRLRTCSYNYHVLYFYINNSMRCSTKIYYESLSQMYFVFPFLFCTLSSSWTVM